MLTIPVVVFHTSPRNLNNWAGVKEVYHEPKSLHEIEGFSHKHLALLLHNEDVVEIKD